MMLRVSYKKIKRLYNRSMEDAANEKEVKNILLLACPPLHKDINPDESLVTFVKKFMTKLPVLIASLAGDAIKRPFLILDQRISHLESSVDRIINKYEALANCYSLNTNTTNAATMLKTVTESYSATLKALFSPTTNLGPYSSPHDIQRRLYKMQLILRSIYQLIPNVTPPKRQTIYDFIIELHRALFIVNKDGETEVSMDTSPSDFDTAPKGIGMLFEYEHRIDELVELLKHTMSFDNIAQHLCHLLGLKPFDNEVTESDIAGLLAAIEEKLDTGDRLVTKFESYKESVNMLITEIGNNVTPSMTVIIDSIRNLELFEN